MTTHTLTTRIAHVRRRVRRLMLLQAIAKVVAAVLIALLAAGTIDYLLRSDDRGLRILLSGAVFSVAIWSACSWLVATVRYRLSAIRVAQQMEHCHPELLSGLSSAAAFLEDSVDDNGVSNELRQAAVKQAQQDAASRSFEGVVNRRPTLWALLAMQTLIVIVLVVYLVAPRTSEVAVRRLALPFADSPWPPRHELVLTGVSHAIPAGGDFSFSVSNRHGSLPRDLVVQYWFVGRPETDIDEYVLQPDVGEDRVLHELAGVTEGFQYRVLGGDDRDMQWRTVRVIEPAELISLQSTIHSPEYVPWPRKSSPGAISALVGSRVEVAGSATKPLAAATVHVRAGDRIEQFSAGVDSSGYKFVLSADRTRPWLVSESGEFWITLRDLEAGVPFETQRWPVEASFDQPPTLQVHLPATISVATPSGYLPVKVEAADDVAIDKIEVVANNPATGRLSVRRSLYERSTDRTGQRPATITRDGAARDVVTVSQDCDLASWGEVAAGQTLKLRMIATDVMQKVVHSDLLEVSIIAADDLTDQIAERQSQLLEKLQEVFSGQQDVLTATQDARGQVAQTAELDLAALRNIEFRQRQIQQRLAGENEGMLDQIRRLVEVLRRNRLDETDLSRNLRAASRDLAILSAGGLASAGNSLSAAVRTAESEEPDVSRMKRELAMASEAQQQVVVFLKSILDTLVEWDRYNSILRQWTNLIAELEGCALGVGEHLEDAGEDTAQLDNQQLDSLRRLSRSQWNIANRLRHLLAEADIAAGQLRPIDAGVARALRDVIQVADEGRLTETVESAAHEIQANHVGLALAQQKSAIRLMTELARALRMDADDSQHETTSGDHLAPLRVVIVDMLNRQTAIQKGVVFVHRMRAESGGVTRPVAIRVADLLERQRQLVQECEQMAAMCDGAPAIAQAIRAARRSMLNVTSGLAAQETGAKIAAAADRARMQLTYIAHALTKRVAAGVPDPQTENGGSGGKRKELSIEQLRLIEMLQRDINVRTRELQAARESTGTLSAEQQTELAELAKEQAALADALVELIRGLGDEPATSEFEGQGLGDLSTPEDAANETEE